MKKIILLLVLSFCIFNVEKTFSQNSEEKITPVNIGICYPVSSGGTAAAEYTHFFSFNVLVGVSKNEKAFAFAGLANIIRNNARGLQFAGLYNSIGNDGKGVVFSGLMSQTGNYQGIQFGGLGNISKDVQGLQFGGLGNISKEVQGLQFGGLGNISKEVQGLQFGGLGNISKDVQGLQFGGLGNISKDARGLQFGGLCNISEEMRGLQFGGLFNMSENITGLQFGGLFNVAKRVKGVQFAGLVNVAEESDYPIGLINIIKKGEKSIGFTYNESGNLTFSFRSGGRILYGIVGAGYSFRASDSPYVLEAGFGAHIPCLSWFRINTELKSSFLSSFTEENEKNTNVNSFSILPAFRIVRGLEIFAGPSLNFANIAHCDNTKGLLPYEPIWVDVRKQETRQLYVGFSVGVQYVFN